MARVLRRAGFDIVLWNRTAERAARLGDDIDARVADSPAAAAAEADVILSSLADDDALIEAYLGESGIVEGLGPDAVAVDTSTVDPSTVIRVGERVDAIGAEFLDCPVSGSVSTVEAAQLTIMAGGEPEVIARAAPVLSTISKRVIRVGGRGAGAACKLAVNSLLHGLNIALSEALVLAERAGVDRRIAYEVFTSGAAGAPFLHYKRAAYEDPDDATVAFSLDLVAKDLDLITGLGSRVGLPMQQASTGLEIVNAAIAAGMGEDDLSAVAVFLRKAAG